MDDNTKIITDQPIVNIASPSDSPIIPTPPISESKTTELSTNNPQDVDNLQVDTKSEEQQNNNDKKLTGFQLHPENINKNGAPKRDWTWKDLYKEVAEEMFEVKQKDGTTLRSQFKQLVAKRIFREAVNGNIGAIKELANRMDGMPKQVVEQTGEINLNVNDMLTKVYGNTEPDSTE